jgi:hypothetical protein
MDILVRLLVAFACFALSVSLTNFTKLFRGADSSIGVVRLEAVESNTAFLADENRLRELYREYGPAQMRHDRAFFERIEGDDFRLFFDNTSISREEDIRWMEENPMDFVYDNQPQEIRIFGNSAVVRGSFEVRTGNGNVHRWETIDIWIKRGGHWKIRSTTSGY